MLERSRRALDRVRRPSATGRPAAPRKRSRGTPPNVVGKPPLLSMPGLNLGVVVIVRNEAPYLEEWLAYHHALGVAHFFIYDNGSTDGLREIIEPWLNHGLVTLVHWPLPGGQIDAYGHALRFFGPSFAWLAFFDVDEFVVPLVDEDIPSLLARWPDAADVRLPRKDFGFSGHRQAPAALTIEAYTDVADVFGRDPAKPPRVKTVLRPQSVTAVGIHTATVADDPVDAEGAPVPSRTIAREVHGLAQLNHYYTRSFEEFEAKRVRGSATGRIARPAIPFDLPALETDRSATRFAARTRSVIEFMRSLDPSPYHYGSQLAISQFPRFNDLGLFAEFAIANTVSGEPEPRREPGLRLPNLFDGTGFVADLSAAGYAPARGSLSGSVHLGPLLGRARGHVETSWAASPETVASSVRAGALTEEAGRWLLHGDDQEGAEVRLSVDSGGQRRCYALGFVLEASAPVRLRLELRGDDSDSPAPLDVRLDHAASYAGVVEFDARPRLATELIVRLFPDGDELVTHDLFVITYG